MTTTYVPLKYAKKAMREVREESLREGERRGYARATEFVRMASSLNGSTHAVLKALQEEGDGLATPRNRMVPVDGDGAAVDGAPDGDLDAVLMAALDALAEAKTHHPETDGGPVYAYLAGLLADPEALADALAEMDGGEVVGKSFDESKHPRGDNGRFIGREQIHAAKSDPKLADELRAKTTDPEQRKKLEAALKGDVDLGRTKAGEHRERVAKQRQDRQERVKRAQELANDISMWRRGGEAVPASHFRELAEVLPSMTVAELRSVRGKLAASFGGERRKSEMAARLLEHAKNKAALLETNERNEDMDALDFGSLHEYQNEGNAKGNEARNPNPEEQHGGRMQQRHDLMGAGAKGELNAPGKLSHGTPDTGSVLKLGDKPAPPPQTEPSKLVTPDKPPTQSDVVQGNADVASEKHNQSHNSAESEPVYTSPDPEHVADIARARDADKKFRGEGRYEAEVWQKLRNSNPDKPMPPLSRDAAEWLADGYERDGKPIPDEVLKDNPDLRGQYQKTAAPAASDTPLSPAVHDAVKDAVKHHKRMNMPGKPVPQMVVYHIQEHRNTGGQLIEPAKVNAVPVNSYTGEQLLSGKLPHLKIEGTFEVGADGTPKRVEGADFTKSINDAITSTPSTHGDARFIHHVYDAMRQKNPSLTRDEFNRQLIDAHKRRDITLSRLDMPQGHATADIQAARVPHMNAEFHFVEPNGKRATQTKAIPSDWDDLRAELAVRRGIVHDDGATGV